MDKPTNKAELLRLIDRAADEGWTELDLAEAYGNSCHCIHNLLALT